MKENKHLCAKPIQYCKRSANKFVWLLELAYTVSLKQYENACNFWPVDYLKKKKKNIFLKKMYRNAIIFKAFRIQYLHF